MTTMELIEKYGIGVNCLSDAYDLGVKQGRADERTEVTDKIDAVIQYIKDNSIYCNLEDKRFKVFGSNVLIDLLEQIKENNNELP